MKFCQDGLIVLALFCVTGCLQADTAWRRIGDAIDSCLS